MEPFDASKLDSCDLLMPAIVPKEESLQYLTVNSDIYHQWKNLGHNHSLPSDSQIADFLLRHYEKTSGLLLSECVKCGGPLTQYCVKCNIYVGQPSSSSPPLQLDNASLTSCQSSMLAGKTIILDLTDAVHDQSQSQSIITIQMTGDADSSAFETKDMTDNPSHLAALVEACAIKGEVSLQELTTSKEAQEVLDSYSSRKPLSTQELHLIQSDSSIASQIQSGNNRRSDKHRCLTSEDPLEVNKCESSAADSSNQQEVQHFDSSADENLQAPKMESGDDIQALINKVKASYASGEFADSSIKKDTASSDLDTRCRTKKENLCHANSNLEGRVIIITGQTDSEDELPQITTSRKRTVRRRKSDAQKTAVLNSDGVIIFTEIADITDESEASADPKRRNSTEECSIQKEKIKPEHPCELCGQILRSKYELEGHLRVHRGERPFKCSQCDASYTRPYHLTAHLSKHALIKPHQCPHCPKAFTRLGDLRSHESTHSTNRPFICEVCGFATKTLNNLKHHKRIHDGTNKTFVCPQCNMKFRWRSNFRDHLKIHEDDRSFACPHCDMKYIQSGSLKRHLDRKHVPNRPRPFVCEICGASRYEKTQFEKHMMIHTGIKPFKCDICGAAFIQSNALRGHMKIHTETEGKSNWCSLCGAAFKRFASLKKHIKKVHSDYLPEDLSIETLEIPI